MTTTSTPATTRPPVNALAAVSFVISLLGFNVVGIILGSVALGQVKRKGDRGRGLALAAIWIGALSLILFIVILILWAVNGAPAGGA